MRRAVPRRLDAATVRRLTSRAVFTDFDGLTESLAASDMSLAVNSFDASYNPF